MTFEEIKTKFENCPTMSIVEIKDIQYGKCISLSNGGKGDICYNPANLKFGVICINNFGDAIFSPIYVTFEVIGNVSSEYLSNYLMRWDFIKAVRKYEEGTVFERMAVKPEDFLKYEMLLPPYEEQVAIAEILAVADKEIDLRRQELEQEKQKKKALMQLLLTGIVRV